MTTITALLLGLAMAAGQAGPGQVAPGRTGAEQNSQLSDTVFKNVKVLKGIPVDEFMDTMGMFASSSVTTAAVATPRKSAPIARRSPSKLRWFRGREA